MIDVGSVGSSSFELVSSAAVVVIDNIGTGDVFLVDLFVCETTPPRSSGNTSGLKYTRDRSTIAPVLNMKIAYL